MGNARGNRYSRNHTTLNPNFDANFWNFSWHEIGVHDLPAMINYVLDATGFQKLGYFGHSQVMCNQSLILFTSRISSEFYSLPITVTTLGYHRLFCDGIHASGTES